MHIKQIKLLLMLTVVPFIHIFLSIVLISLLAGCAAEIKMTARGIYGETCETTVTTARRVAISMQGCNGATVISGQVLINDETVQALGSNASEAFQSGVYEGRVQQTKEFNRQGDTK